MKSIQSFYGYKIVVLICWKFVSFKFEKRRKKEKKKKCLGCGSEWGIEGRGKKNGSNNLH